MTAQVAITRVEAKAMCVAEMLRPANIEIARAGGDAAAQRDVVEEGQVMLRAGRQLRRIDAFRRMRVDRPAAIRDGIGEGARSRAGRSR